MRWGVYLLSLLLCGSVFGFDGKVLQLTLINESKETLTFKSVSNSFPGNEFNLETFVLFPHSRTLISGRIVSENDLAGYLHFEDATGKDNMLIILDPRKMHIVQSQFNFSSLKVRSTVMDKQFNWEGSPRELWVSKVTVTLRDKVN